jgi:hypothetical protein
MTRLILLFAFYSGVLVVLTNHASAEMPAAVYRRMQDTAPEMLDIKVLSVDRNFKGREVEEKNKRKARVETTSVVMTVRVETVSRTATGLKSGSIITINYQRKVHYHQVQDKYLPSPGAHLPATLNVGDTMKAYLRQTSDRTYSIAAEGESFIGLRR